VQDRIKNLAYYLHAFKTLRRDYKKGGAPHKPVLLLSIIQLFESGVIDSNRIFISPELVGTFKSTWNALVSTGHDMIFALPFYHMQSEPFWQLFPNAGCEKWIEAKGSMRSFGNLNTAVAYAQIDNELFELLKEKDSREVLKYTLLEKYFPDTRVNLTGGGSGYITEITNEILQEGAETYRTRIQELKRRLDEDTYQEEIFVRSGIFKREVPRIYNHTCCISGLRVDATINVTMVDACHIVPFSISYDDTITNGLALCPNLHRAFDRGLIAISDDYRVIVSDAFVEDESSYSIRQFAGKEILLPGRREWWPERGKVEWHREWVGKTQVPSSKFQGAF
jgi:putative restriction endonuclease